MDIIQLLKDEHQRVLRMFDTFDTLTGEASREQLLIQLVQELSVHEEAEELAVWRELRYRLTDSVVLDAPIREEMNLKTLLEEGVLNLGRSDVSADVGRVRALVTQHIRTEEDRIAPLIEAQLDEEARRELAAAYLRAKASQIAQMARLNVIMAPETPADQAQRM